MRFFGRKKDEEKERREEIPSLEDLKELSGDEIFDEIFRRAIENRKKEGEPIEETAPGHYKVKHVASGTSTSSSGDINETGPASYAEETKSEERREEAMKFDPPNRDEILLEILKELKELNANVKALIVRADIGRQEVRELAEDIYARLKQKLDNMTMGMGGW